MREREKRGQLYYADGAPYTQKETRFHCVCFGLSSVLAILPVFALHFGITHQSAIRLYQTVSGIRTLQPYTSILPFHFSCHCRTISTYIMNLQILQFYFYFIQSIIFFYQSTIFLKNYFPFTQMFIISCPLHSFVQIQVATWYHFPSPEEFPITFLTQVYGQQILSPFICIKKKQSLF